MTDLDQSTVQTRLATPDTQPPRAAAPKYPPAPEPRPSLLRAWLRRDLSDPFFRNANALIANTGLTAILGLAFWAIAARLFTDPDVGRGSALVSAMTVLSGVIAINLSGTLSRFIPDGGKRTWLMALSAYAFSTVVVLVLTAAFLLSLGRWGPSFELLRDPTTAAWFFAAVVAAGIFTVQDGVLVGLRSAVWVPVENVLFGAAKAALLVPFAVLFPRDGVYLAWVIPMALLIVPVNALIFGRLVPRHVRASPADAVPPAPRAIGRFFVADYAGALFMFGAATLPPVLVAPFVQPWTFAYFYIAWITAGALNLVSHNLASSLTVEGVYEVRRLGVNCRAALRRGLVLLVSAAVFVGVLAPYGLGLLGRGYLDAVPMLQALALAAVPRLVIELWVGVLRAHSRTRTIAHVQIAAGGGAIGAVVAWLYLKTTIGVPGIELITGVGLAVLASQVIVAAAVLPQMLRFVRETTPDPPPRSLPARSDAARPDVAATVPTKVRPSEPSEQAAARPQRVTLGVLVVAATAAAAVAVSGLLTIDPDTMNGYGLISVVPVTTLVGLGLLTLVFVGTLALHRPHRVFLCLQIVAMTCCLHGAAAFYATEPRFPVTWIHLGFVDFISRTGSVAGELDGRFSWPGFFALVAFWLGPAAGSALLPALKLVPLLSNLLYLLPFALLLRNLRMSWQAKWFAAWIFVVADWIGQDYFSPQGGAYWLYLVFLAGLVTWLRPPVWQGLRSARLRRWLGRLRLPVPSVAGELPPTPVAPGVQSAILLLLIGVFLVATFSHQLTPFIMLAACTGLVLARRCTTSWLPLLLAAVLVSWISYLAFAYWGGHLGELFGGIGDIGGNIRTSIVERTGFGQQHEQVVAMRVGLALTVGALAAVGLLRRLRRGVDDRTVLVLLLAPLAAMGLQSYGGEIALRVYFFALPGAVVLAACAFFPEPGAVAPRPGRYLLLGPIALVLVGGFLVARYGNEAYERIDAGAVAAVEFVYQHDGPVRVVALTGSSPVDASPPFLPIGYRDIERTSYDTLPAPKDPDDLTEIVATLGHLGPNAYLVRTAETDAFLTVREGFPIDWGERFDRRVAAGRELQLVAAAADARVYRLNAPGEPPPPPAPVVTGVEVGRTPSTPLGVVFLGALVSIVVWREVWRLRGRPVPDRMVVAVCSVLSLGLLAAIIERLLLLA